MTSIMPRQQHNAYIPITMSGSVGCLGFRRVVPVRRGKREEKLAAMLSCLRLSGQEVSDLVIGPTINCTCHKTLFHIGMLMYSITARAQPKDAKDAKDAKDDEDSKCKLCKHHKKKHTTVVISDVLAKYTNWPKERSGDCLAIEDIFFGQPS
ncbi:hypothetical protein B0H14DRAFT_2564717 [Mycena olivaceomarginata]|nr:hypothetical protein B0H14DRAFT_2564717 [Mycena olivaceomarginata]